MAINIFDKGFDKVVKSVFCSGKTTYKYAIDFFYPQIDKYSGQRKKLDEKFYQKLQRDIANGCIMPAITIALVTNNIEDLINKGISEIPKYIDDNKSDLFILDGIQRLNTLQRGYVEDLKEYPIYFNLLVSDKEDRLLYRMITLNNGQKPMSARHQIEVLAHNIFDFGNGLAVQTEKQRSKRVIKGSFNKDDIIKGYISYLSETVNIDNQKIIESKMDELIADKIIESNVTQGENDFKSVITLIEKFCSEPYLLTWFKQTNNLIGFCAAIGKHYENIGSETTESFKDMVEKFELAFSSFDISKIKLGHLRRITVNYFISKYAHLKSLSQGEIADSISQASMLYM